ncbi:MAG: hypothetical protein GC205_13275 [Bacteroidetes bacterium]|nr:hypothetical protein [Bacteroidota bacterium]
MKHLLFFFVFIPCLATAQTGQVKQVLFIGNSYTARNELPAMVADIANSFGHTLLWDANLIGGSSFANHASNATTLTKIAQGNWDVVVLQEQSQLPALDPVSVASSVYPYAQSLVEALRGANPCTSPVFYMTWGRENGDDENCGSYPPVCSYDGMQGRLRDSYLQMAQDNDAAVAPVGMAWKAVRDDHPGINLYNADESHPSFGGTYLAACVLYATIFQESPAGAFIPAGVSPATANDLQQKAALTVFDSLMVWGIDPVSVRSDLVISGIFDGPLSSAPRGVELYVERDIADLSVYGLGSANNGDGSDGQEFTFPAIAAHAGDYLYVVNDAAAFQTFFGFVPDYEDPVSGISGDDGYELFKNGIRLDLFGRTDLDGTGTGWDYQDGWAYRKNCAGCGGTNFVQSNWIYSGVSAFDGALTNAASLLPFPIKTYAGGCDSVAPPPVLVDSGLALIGIFHGPLSGSPKGVELLALKNIPDLSQYGLGCANNGEGTDGEEYSFPAVSVAIGTHFYVTNDTSSFRVFFHEAAQFEDGGAACNFNGDDAFELYESGSVIDRFGDADVDGTGEPWEYTLSWAHRLSGGPDGNVFALGNWEVGPLEVFDGESTNAAAAIPYPIFVPATCSTALPPQNLQSTTGSSTITLFWDPVPNSVACQLKGTRIIPPGPSSSITLLGSELSFKTISHAVAGSGTTWDWKVRCACNLSPLQVTGFSSTGSFSVP